FTGSPSANWEDATKVLDQFDEAWLKGATPQLESYVPPATNRSSGDPLRQKLLNELIKIDLEYRWRANQHLRLEDYARRYSELGPVNRLPLDLIAWEYRVRHRWGDRPPQAEYMDRFATYGMKLRDALVRIDVELGAEATLGQPQILTDLPPVAAIV